LNAKLFDNVSLDKMADAEKSLRKAVADIPTEVRERFNSDAELSDSDRETIHNIARKAVARFYSESEPKSMLEVKTEGKPKSETQTEGKLKPKAKTEGKPKKET